MDKHYKTPHGDFEWEADKADRNRRKHGVTFEQTAEAFAGPYALVSYDAAHSETEDRFRCLLCHFCGTRGNPHHLSTKGKPYGGTAL